MISNYYKKIAVILVIASIYPTVMVALKVTKKATKI
jgi:hypothetical protein